MVCRPPKVWLSGYLTLVPLVSLGNHPAFFLQTHHQIISPYEHLTPSPRLLQSHSHSLAILRPVFAARVSCHRSSVSNPSQPDTIPSAFSHIPIIFPLPTAQETSQYFQRSSTRLHQHQHVFLRNNHLVYIRDQFKISTNFKEKIH